MEPQFDMSFLAQKPDEKADSAAEATKATEIKQKTEKHQEILRVFTEAGILPIFQSIDAQVLSQQDLDHGIAEATDQNRVELVWGTGFDITKDEDGICSHIQQGRVCDFKVIHATFDQESKNIRINARTNTTLTPEEYKDPETVKKVMTEAFQNPQKIIRKGWEF